MIRRQRFLASLNVKKQRRYAAGGPAARSASIKVSVPPSASRRVTTRSPAAGSMSVTRWFQKHPLPVAATASAVASWYAPSGSKPERECSSKSTRLRSTA